MSSSKLPTLAFAHQRGCIGLSSLRTFWWGVWRNRFARLGAGKVWAHRAAEAGDSNHLQTTNLVRRDGKLVSHMTLDRLQGTISYMSYRLDKGSIDDRSDVYSLGCTVRDSLWKGGV